MAKVIKYSPCPRCRERGKDSRGDNLVSYEDGGAHCFSCGYHEHPKFFKSFNTEPKYVSKSLPHDFTREVPAAGWKYLLQYGLPYSYWKPFTGYSPSSERVVLTVGKPSSPAFSIGRRLVREDRAPDETNRGSRNDGATSNTEPHLLYSPEKKWYVWGDCHTHAERLGNLRRCTVLVEDIISGHKVAQVEETIPLFGTHSHPAHIYALKGTTLPIVLWLDWDQVGLTAKTATRIQLLTNRPVFVCHTRQDPKLLSFETIEKCLTETLT